MAYRGVIEDDPRHALTHWKYITKRKVNGKWQYVYETPDKGKRGPGTYSYVNNKDTINEGPVNEVHVKPNGVVSVARKNSYGLTDEEYFRLLDRKTGITKATMNIEGEIGTVNKKNKKTGVVSTAGKEKKNPDGTKNGYPDIQGEIKTIDKIESVSKTTISKGKKAIDKILNKVIKKSDKKTLEEIYGKKKKADFEFKI